MARLDLETGIFKKRVVDFFSGTDFMIQKNVDEKADDDMQMIESLHKKKLKGRKNQSEEELLMIRRTAQDDEEAAFHNLMKEFSKNTDKVEQARASLADVKDKLTLALTKQVCVYTYLHPYMLIHLWFIVRSLFLKLSEKGEIGL